jgi:hypothetical protein
MFKFHETPEKYYFSVSPSNSRRGLRYGYIKPDQPSSREEAQFFDDSAAFSLDLIGGKDDSFHRI